MKRHLATGYEKQEMLVTLMGYQGGMIPQVNADVLSGIHAQQVGPERRRSMQVFIAGCLRGFWLPFLVLLTIVSALAFAYINL